MDDPCLELALDKGPMVIVFDAPEDWKASLPDGTKLVFFDRGHERRWNFPDSLASLVIGHQFCMTVAPGGATKDLPWVMSPSGCLEDVANIIRDGYRLCPIDFLRVFHSLLWERRFWEIEASLVEGRADARMDEEHIRRAKDRLKRSLTGTYEREMRIGESFLGSHSSTPVPAAANLSSTAYSDHRDRLAEEKVRARKRRRWMSKQRKGNGSPDKLRTDHCGSDSDIADWDWDGKWTGPRMRRSVLSGPKKTMVSPIVVCQAVTNPGRRLISVPPNRHRKKNAMTWWSQIRAGRRQISQGWRRGHRLRIVSAHIGHNYVPVPSIDPSRKVGPIVQKLGRLARERRSTLS
jgi:hypothetical protein